MKHRQKRTFPKSLQVFFFLLIFLFMAIIIIDWGPLLEYYRSNFLQILVLVGFLMMGWWVLLPSRGRKR